MVEPLVRIRGLTVEFRVRRGILRAIDNVDLDIYKGEILGLAGESGCGKSVLAHAILKQVDINGYIKSGKIIWEDGRDILSLEGEELRQFRWREAALVFQAAQNSLNPVLRIGEQIIDTYQAHESQEKEASDISKRIDELLGFVRLDAKKVPSLFPHETSGGMKQRIIISMGLLLTPKLLILDEPTSSLDLLTSKYITTILKELHKKTGITMLFITHDLPVLAEMAERIAIMYCGNIVEIGNVYDIFYDARHPYTRALLKSIPSLTKPLDDVKPLPGPVPDPINLPPGCKFHPRCPYAKDICSKVAPVLERFNKGRHIACHRWREI